MSNYTPDTLPKSESSPPKTSQPLLLKPLSNSNGGGIKLKLSLPNSSNTLKPLKLSQPSQSPQSSQSSQTSQLQASQSPPTSQSSQTSQPIKLTLSSQSIKPLTLSSQSIRPLTLSSQSSQPVKLKLSTPVGLNTPLKLSTIKTTTTTTSSSNSISPNKFKEDTVTECIDLENGSYLINGYKVKFPFKPYECQASMISKILESCDNSTHCVLESATGTGKTLSLLSSTLEWQSQFKLKAAENNKEIKKLKIEKIQNEMNKISPLPNNTGDNPSVKKPNPGKSIFDTDSDTDEDSDDEYKLQTDIVSSAKPLKRKLSEVNRYQSNDEMDSGIFTYGGDKNKKKQEEKKEKEAEKAAEKAAEQVPAIFYCSRTHSQIKQLTGELRKTQYRPRMLVLGSRDQYCINPDLAKETQFRKEKCMKLVKDHQCKFIHNGKDNQATSSKLVAMPEFKTQVWDIENLISAGIKVKECPFYATKDMVESAELIFCPYNYLIDPLIRKSMKNKVRNSIVIFDEAHNIEDAFMDAASFECIFDDINDVFQQAKNILEDRNYGAELKKGAPKKFEAVKEIYYIAEGIAQWINKNYTKCTNVDFEKQVLMIKEEKEIIEAVGQMGVNNANYYNLQNNIELLTAAPGPYGSSDNFENILSPKAMVVLESFANVLTFLYKRESFYMKDYRLAIQRKSIQSGVKGGTKWQTSLHIWAMSPRAAFNSLVQDNVRTVILTSGTLSPLSSFQYELSSRFPIVAELGNLSDIKSRVWIGTLGYAGKEDKIGLDGRLKQSQTFMYQDTLGDTILQHIQIVPHGVLVFFPSYGFMEKVMKRWRDTGLADKLERVKSIFIEPKTGKEFKKTLDDYYDCIKRGSGKGAILFAICRGKISEGIDFSDQYARGVFIVGIPYPSLGDIRVGLKKEYNDKSLSPTGKGISGSFWYTLQAFRALNQAIGRCIRHKNDYGSILLIDERFTQTSNWEHLSKWARYSITNNKNQTNSLSSLREFYKKRSEMEANK